MWWYRRAILAWKIHLLLNSQGILGGECTQVAHGHKRRGVAKMNLQRPRVAGLPQALDGVRVPEQVRIDLLIEPRLPARGADDLVGALAVDREDPVAKLELMAESVGL